MKRFFVIFCIIISNCLFSQGKLQELNEIVVYRQIVRNISNQTVPRSEIELIEPQDLGHLLQRKAGITVKDYGGIGAFKSLSIRGLGAQHTNFFRNGLPIGTVQSGITNLGGIQVDNIENVKISIGGNFSLFLPISSLIGGNSVELKTFENSFTSQRFNLYFTNTIGSFGQFETAAGYKKGGKNYFSISAKQRQFKGVFPYTITKDYGNGSVFSLDGTRQNNQLSEYHFNVGAGFMLDKKYNEGKSKFYSSIELSGEIQDTKKELPGAVIFYGVDPNESLKTDMSSIGVNATIVGNKLNLRPFYKFQYDYLEYTDPDYFTIAPLRSAYTTFSSMSGINATYQWQKLKLYGGIEYDYFYLQSDKFSGAPQRIVFNDALGVNFNIKRITVDLYAAGYITSNNNGNAAERKKHSNLSPKIKLSRPFNFWNSKVELWAKQAWRQASFNELYYSQIGSPDLEPERTMQLSGNYTFSPFNRNVKVSVAGYYNRVYDKIQTLPTKNLFVWSVQNLGEVEIIGSELNIEYTKQLRNRLVLETKFAYTFQQAHDITSEMSQTFENQLAYIPEHTMNGNVALKFYSFTFFTDLNYQSDRFASNENTQVNNLEDMYTLDLSLGYTWSLTFENKIKAKVGVRNLTNQQNQFIPFYPLPGRSIYLKLTYEVR